MRRGFKCIYCHKWVPLDKQIGTTHRNHCPYCLWSKHLDSYSAGDRDSSCGGAMEPLGLTFKHEGFDKYGILPAHGMRRSASGGTDAVPLPASSSFVNWRKGRGFRRRVNKGKPKQGEIMIIHQCVLCGKISINRIAGDDDPKTILSVFDNSTKGNSQLKKIKTKLLEIDIRPLEKTDLKEVKTQLYGES